MKTYAGEDSLVERLNRNTEKLINEEGYNDLNFLPWVIHESVNGEKTLPVDQAEDTVVSHGTGDSSLIVEILLLVAAMGMVVAMTLKKKQVQD